MGKFGGRCAAQPAAAVKAAAVALAAARAGACEAAGETDPAGDEPSVCFQVGGSPAKVAPAPTAGQPRRSIDAVLSAEQLPSPREE